MSTPAEHPRAAAGHASARFSIRFDAWYRPLSELLFLPPAAAYVALEGDEVAVRMGWAFRTSFPRSAVSRVESGPRWTLSRGVHGWAGTWLVNGSGAGILAILLSPPQRAWVVGVPVRLRRLLVSVDRPDALARALSPAGGGLS